MYRKYSNKSYRGQKSDTFSSYGDRAGKISLTDLINWRRDFNLAKFISKDELTTLVRLINLKRGIKKEEVRFMDLKGFNDLYT